MNCFGATGLCLLFFLFCYFTISFNDISSEAIFFDGAKMLAGYALMFLYTALFLSGGGLRHLNSVEHRALLTGAGIAAVAMGLAVAFGATGALGLPHTPMHAILPFLGLGIGIDDMFVIVQCWNNLVRVAIWDCSTNACCSIR